MRRVSYTANAGLWKLCNVCLLVRSILSYNLATVVSDSKTIVAWKLAPIGLCKDAGKV